MKTPQHITQSLKAIALAGSFSFVATSATEAAFKPLPPNGVEASVALDPPTLFAPVGIQVAAADSPFSETINNEFSGILHTRVFNRGAGLLDFYYEISNLSPGKPPVGLGGDSDIYRFATDNNTFSGAAGQNLFVDSTTFPVGGIPSGTKFVPFADNNFSPGAVGFEYTSFIGSPNNLDVGQTSQWLIVRTNSTTFTSVTGLISGFGTGLAQTFEPVPEPATIGFGVAILGVCAGSWLKGRRKLAA